ncbi:hypothetical protein D5086_027074 [Populus alba]|uniref:Uncharacterized protein n=1 Tax=Populus alba TaxID=43335 RepID=A0ACC4B3P1_POPAL
MLSLLKVGSVAAIYVIAQRVFVEENSGHDASQSCPEVDPSCPEQENLTNQQHHCLCQRQVCQIGLEEWASDQHFEIEEANMDCQRTRIGVLHVASGSLSELLTLKP